MDKVSNESKKILLDEIIRELIRNSTNPNFEIFNYQPQPVVFIVDDAQYIDKESWEYLSLLGLTESSKCFFLSSNRFPFRFSIDVPFNRCHARSNIER